MLRTNLWNDSVSRVVLDHRSREAHLQLERLERLLVHVPQWRLSGSDGFFVLFQRRIYGGARRESRTMEPLSDRPPSPMPTIIEVWRLEEALR